MALPAQEDYGSGHLSVQSAPLQVGKRVPHEREGRPKQQHLLPQHTLRAQILQQ